MENQIRFEIKECLCVVCKVPIVEEFSLVYGEHNGIFGPGGYAPSWVEGEFYCPRCGIHYKSTERNNLARNEEFRKDQAEKILRSTGKVSLKRDLKKGEVFEILKSSEGVFSYLPHTPSTFSKDDSLRNHFQSDEYFLDNISLDFEKPFIIPIKGSAKSKLVFWAPNKSYWAIKSKKSILAEKKSGSVRNKTQKILDTLALEGKTQTLRYRKTKPLPEGSVEAVRVFCESLGYEKEFYIPKDAI